MCGNVLDISNLTLKLGGKKILNNINVSFKDNFIYAIVGSNGAGKSTLAGTIMGRHGYKNYSGDIILEGKSLNSMGVDERAKLGITLAWQEPARFEGLKIEDFLKASDRELDDKGIDKLLESVSLKPGSYKERPLDRALSGGERKKLELASILAMKPKFVMLDEPDSGIDVASLENIFQAIKELKNIGSTVVLITHSSAVLRHAEHAFLMCCGRIVEQGEVGKVLPYFEEKCIPCDHADAYELNGDKSDN
ncbi:MAG: ATP-binding cassette domain-containing protein [Candidatus Nanoarchaeia archaeon]